MFLEMPVFSFSSGFITLSHETSSTPPLYVWSRPLGLARLSSLAHRLKHTSCSIDGNHGRCKTTSGGLRGTAMSEAEAQPSADSAEEPVEVAAAETLSERGRLHVTVQGRYITVLKLNGKLHAIDSVCFHAGGPLGIGDIEDVNGKDCIVCPWHYYKIDVETGDKYYQAGIWENGKMKLGDWKSNGVKQRVHAASETDGKIYVTVGKEGFVDSDGYAFNDACGQRMQGKDGHSARGQQGIGADGKLPSGHVFQRRGA